MAANKGKIVFRVYTISDFDKEEKFLREQHRQGYKFVKWTFPGFYCFEKCEPQDVIYRLELGNVKDREKSEYIQMYEDFGWNYMFDAIGWSYFKKAADEKDGNEELFSDKQSKIAHLERVFRKRLCPCIVIFLCCVIPNFTKVVNEGAWALGYKIWNGSWIVMFILYIFVLVYCSWRFFKLKKEYSGS